MIDVFCVSPAFLPVCLIPLSLPPLPPLPLSFVQMWVVDVESLLSSMARQLVSTSKPVCVLWGIRVPSQRIACLLWSDAEFWDAFQKGALRL